MSTKEFFTELHDYLSQTITHLNALETDVQITTDKLNSRAYSDDHKAKVLRPALSELKLKQRNMAEEAELKCKKICEDFRLSLSGRTFDPAELTDDAKLLSLGVRIPDADLERIFDRNAGNYTMEKLICSYADQHGIHLKRRPKDPNEELLTVVGSLPEVCRYTIKNHPYPGYFDQFWGENSSIRKSLCN